jgi:hypothetical protein
MASHAARHQLQLGGPEWLQERFEQIKAALQPFLRASGFRDGAVQWLPAVGPAGENLVRPPQATSFLPSEAFPVNRAVRVFMLGFSVAGAD